MRRHAALILVIGLILSAQAFAQSGLADSSWPIFRHDVSLTARASSVGPSIPAVKWTLPLGNGRLGSPVVGPDGTIYVPGNEDNKLYAVTRDGRVRWVFTGMPDEQFVAPPVIGQDGTIYFGSTKNIFYALNPDGSERWRLTLSGEVRSSANLGNDGTIYVVTRAYRDYRLYAITPKGKVKTNWPVDLGEIPENGPAIASDGTIYVVAGEFLKGFSPEGQPLLEFNCIDINDLYGLMVENKELIYVTSIKTPAIKAIRNDSTLRWQHSYTDNFGGALCPALGKTGNIYFASTKDGGLFALDHDGNKRWTFALPGTENLTEMVLDADENIYIVNDSLGLMSVSPEGKLRWNLPEVRCAFSPAFGDNGIIYIAGDSKLYAVGPQPPYAASLVKVSGDLQEGCIETILPDTIKVKVVDQYETPYPGQQVEFNILSGGGEVFIINNITDQDGIARARWKLGSIPGEQKLLVTSKGISDSLIFTATAKLAKISGAPEVRFDTTAVKSVSKKIYVIQNPSSCTLSLDSLKILNGSSFAVTDTGFPKQILPFDSLHLQFQPLVAGTHSATLRIFNNSDQPQFDVKLFGVAVDRPKITVEPETLNFGGICTGSSKDSFLTIFNIGTADLEVTNFTVTDPAFKVIDDPTPFVLRPEGQRMIKVQYTPKEAIPYDATLSIFSNDLNANPYPVKLLGKGVTPDVALTATPPEFGRICLGEAVSSQVCIVNPSDCVLRVDSVAVSYSEGMLLSQRSQNQPTSTPIIIKPHEKFCFNVGAKPKSLGKFQVEVTVWSNASPSPISIVIPGTVGAPKITVSKKAIEFDSVEVQTCAGKTNFATQPLAIRNVGSCNLKIDSLITALPFSVEPLIPPPQLLPPDSSLTVTLKFTPDDSGRFSGKLRIVSNDPSEPVIVIPLQGRGVKQPDIEVTPLALDFKPVPVGDSAFKSITIANVGELLLAVERLVVNPPFFIETDEFALECNQDSVVQIAFIPNAPGSFSDTLRIFSNDPDERIVKVPLHGIGCIPDIALTATPPGFGKICLGSVASTQVCIINPGDCELRVDSLTVLFTSAALLKASPQPLLTPAPAMPIIIPPHEKFCFNVNAKPQKVGDFCVEITIWSNVPAKNPISISVCGTVVPPVIAGDDSVKFGKVPVGDALQKVARVWNADSCHVVIDSLQIVGPEAADFFTCGISKKELSPGDTAEICVGFTPKRDGLRTATLLVYNNDPARNPWKIALTGEGICTGPQLAVEPEELHFGDVALGDTEVDTLTVSNPGCAILPDIKLRITSKVYWVKPEDTTFALPAKASRQVPVYFAPMDAIYYPDSLKVVSNVGTVVVQLDGRGKPPYIASPDSLKFPSPVCIGSSAFLEVKICNVSKHELVVDTVITGQPQFKPEPANDIFIPSGPNSCRTIIVGFTPDSAGTFEDTLTVVWANLAPLKIPLSGTGIAPKITDSDTLLRFDRIPIGSSQKKFAKITNTGKCELRITEVISTDPIAFQPDTDRLPSTIPPGKEDSIGVTFTPKHLGIHMATLVVFNNDPENKQFKIALVGEGDSCAAVIAVAPSALPFGAVALGDTLVKKVTVSNISTCNSTLHVSGISTTNPVFWVNPEDRQFNLSKGDSHEVFVYFAPKDAIPYPDSLKVTSDDPKQPTVNVPLNGSGKLPYTVDPPKVSYGQICVDSVIYIPIKICNVSNHWLNADAIRTSQQQFNVEPNEIGIPPNSCRTVTVSFKPDTIGTFVDTLIVVWTKDLNLPPLRVPLDGKGVAPQIAAAPVEFVFVHIGDTGKKFATIKNEGECVLRIDSYAIVGPDDSAFVADQKPSPWLIPPKSSDQIGITFTSVTLDTHKAFLRLWTNDLDNKQFEVRLTASKTIECALAVSPEKLLFKNPVRINSSDSAWVRVTNTGNVEVLVNFEIQNPNYRLDRYSLRLSPYSVDSIQVIFTPNIAGVLKEDLKIYPTELAKGFSGTCNPQKVVLSGTGLGRQGAYVYVRPNPFTPNGDGYNDVDTLKFHDFVLFKPVWKIFDLRGAPVNSIQAKDGAREIPWNGRDDRGNLVLPGVYVWILQDGSNKVASGIVTVIR
ncbi:MAG: choice-of-anchor D domain-containing protein [candidate division KSB1 bacterium]|nr:choice-of-anchor D domain-containing protein [candidate division KSB1 bacterium]MDZ7305150.1 choice-of-anchor D domain-containing protein [candidate division KSB1 bacterium]MDZ7314234.1 choice-of-anchor D domain-containing protein [candidate division KSB1 bacterium]